MTCAAAQQTSYAVSINPQQQQPSAVLRHQEPEPLTLMLGVCLAFWGVSVTVSAGIGVLMKLAGRPLAYAASSRGGGSWTSTSVVDSDIMPLFLTYEDEQQPAVSRVPRDGGAGTAYRPWTGPDSYIPGGSRCVSGTQLPGASVRHPRLSQLWQAVPPLPKTPGHC